MGDEHLTRAVGQFGILQGQLDKIAAAVDKGQTNTNATLREIVEGVDVLRDEMGSLRGEVASVRSDVGWLKQANAAVANELATHRQRLDTIDTWRSAQEAGDDERLGQRIRIALGYGAAAFVAAYLAAQLIWHALSVAFNIGRS